MHGTTLLCDYNFTVSLTISSSGPVRNTRSTLEVCLRSQTTHFSALIDFFCVERCKKSNKFGVSNEFFSYPWSCVGKAILDNQNDGKNLNSL